MTTDELTTDEAIRLMSDLDHGTNALGQVLSPEIRQRLFAVADNPTSQTWDDSHSILLTGMTTLWQALISFTDYQVLTHSFDGEWSQIPTREQILTAIQMTLLR